MDYATALLIIPGLLDLISKIIEIFNREEKFFHKKLKGKGINEKLRELEEKLNQIQAFRETLLFYARLLPETASVHTLSDKLYEMIQASRSDLKNVNSENHDSSWRIISMMYNSVKDHKNSQLVSRMSNCPLDVGTEQIRDINVQIMNFDGEFERADAYLNGRQTDNMLDQTQRISQIASNLKLLALRQTENLISSISTGKLKVGSDQAR